MARVLVENLNKVTSGSLPDMVDFVRLDPGADFTKGLNSRFGLKFKTWVLNFVNRILSLWSYT